MKFDQLLVYSMRKNVLKKLYTKCGRENIHGLLSISLDHYSTQLLRAIEIY